MCVCAVTNSLMFGGGNYAQYTLNETAVSSSVGFNRASRQAPTVLRSTFTDLLSFRFRTESDRGIVFYIGEVDGTGDFSYVQLQEGGSISYHINLGAGEERVNIMPPNSSSSANDAQWHVFEVERTGFNLILTLDNFTLSHKLGGNQLDLNLDVGYSDFYAGGIPNAPERTYTGCLEDIRVDRNPLPTSDSNKLATVIFGGDSSISLGCALRACFPNPCRGGNCTEIGERDFSCSCRDGSRFRSQPCPLTPRTTKYLLLIIICAVIGGLLLLSILISCGKIFNFYNCYVYS